MVTIINIANNGDGSYSVQFSQAVAANPLTAEPQIVFFSPSAAGWYGVFSQSNDDATTVRFQEVNEDTDCTLFALLGQPSTLTASATFEVATPTIPIT